MKRMIRISFLLMAIVMVFSVSCDKIKQKTQPEQQQMGPGGMGGGNFDPSVFVDRQMEELKEKLELSDDQEKQVREIIITSFETMRNARDEMRDGDRDAMREKMLQMREEQKQKIKAVLSEDQFVKYEQILKERSERMRQGGGFGGPQN